MTEIDFAKLRRLMVDWSEHEHWIQNGCRNATAHELCVPGYQVVARQGAEAYDLYRHSLVPYFATAHGFGGLHEDLATLVNEVKKKHPELTSWLLGDYLEPDAIFRAQWNNLFDAVSHEGLTHQSLLHYQRKFEIELPLCFLANVEELWRTGSFDPELSRFRNRSGKLKKGMVAQHIRDGFAAFPALRSAVALAYNAKLRNAIAHNAYAIDQTRISALDGTVALTESEFVVHLDALQALQNAVVWLFSSRFNEKPSCFRSTGVLTIAWGRIPGSAKPHLFIFQLAPFFNLTRQAQWLHKVVLQDVDGRLVTRLGNAPAIEGPIPDALRAMLRDIRRSGHLHCVLVPVMPCIHQHAPHVLQHGEFCQVVEGAERTVIVENAE